jgi:hypothetical protein
MFVFQYIDGAATQEAGDGYFAKILQPAGFKGMITKTALEPVLKALRLQIVLVDDYEAAAALGPLPERNAAQVRLNNDCRRNKGRCKCPRPDGYIPGKRGVSKYG